MECGTEFLPGKRFCFECGSPTPVRCGSCGEPLEDRFKFCPECGTPSGQANHATNGGNDTLLRHVPEELAAKIRKAGAVAGERKRATVMFCDLVGSTAIAEGIDPETYRELLDEYLKLAFAEVYQYEGIVNQMAGDGFMALFGAPIAHEDSPERAVHAALGIQRALAQLGERVRRERGIELRARVGIHTGTVVVGAMGSDAKTDYTAIGDTTNLAARLQGLAEPDTILISEDTHALVRGHFVTQSVGEVDIRGRNRPIVAYEVTGSVESAPMAIAEERGLTPLVGREPELAQLAACFKRLEDNLAQLVAIVGDTGSGKSRLVYEAKQQVDADTAYILEGRCASLTRGTPYAPWRVILRSFFGWDEPDDAAKERIAEEVAIFCADEASRIAPCVCAVLGVPYQGETKTPGDFSQQSIFEAVTKLIALAAGRRPTLLIVEDLHWIDEASLELLEMVLASCHNERVMLVVTHRSDFNLNWRTPAAFTQLRLRLLSDGEARRILRNLVSGELPAALEDRILSRGEGNPFYVEELTRALLEEGTLRIGEAGPEVTRPVEAIRIPDTVQELLGARLDRLQPGAKRIAQVASIFGRQFKRSQLESLLETTGFSGRVSEALDELEQRGVIHREGMSVDEYRFGESLTQEVAYEGLLLRERRMLHGELGRIFEADPGSSEDLALIGYHFARSDDQKKGIATLLAAGNQAAGLPSYGDAIRHYRKALDLAEAAQTNDAKPDPDLQRHTLQAIQGILAAVNIYGDARFEENERALKRGLVLAEELGDQEALADLHVAHGTMILNNSSSRFSEGIVHIEEGVEVARRAGLARSVARLSRSLSWAYLKDGRFAEARACIAGVLEELERLGDREKVSDTYLGARFFQNRVLFESDAFEEALANALETYELGRSHDNRTIETSAAAQLAALYFRRGEYEEALSIATRNVPVAQEIGNVWSMLTCSAVIQGIRHTEDPTQVDLSVLDTIERGTRTSGDSSMSTDLITEVLMRIGEVERARRVAESGVERSGGRLNESRNELCLGYVALFSSDDQLADAKRHFWRSIELAEEIGSRSLEGRALLGLAILFHSQGEETFRTYASRALEIFQSLGLRRYERRAEVLLK